MSRSGCGVKRVVRCTGTGRGVRRRKVVGVEFGPASVCTRGAPQLHLLECWLPARVVGVSWVDCFGRQKTFESELARTRGIRLSN
jgi:hypothetical protein